MGNGGPERISDYDSRSQNGDDFDAQGDLDADHLEAIDRQVERLCRTLPPDVQEKVRRFEAIRRTGNSSGTFTALHAQRVMGGVEKNPRSVCERQLESNVNWQEYPTRLRAAIREQMIEDMTTGQLLTDNQLTILLESQPMVQSWRERNYIDVNGLDHNAMKEAELSLLKRNTDKEKIRVSAQKEKEWADKIYSEKADKMMEGMLEENRTYQKLPPELQRSIEDSIRQFFFVRVEPTQQELSDFIEGAHIVQDYYKARLSDALALHDAYQSFSTLIQQKILGDLQKWFNIYVPMSLEAITDFIERHPVVLDYYEKILNDGGFEADEVPTQNDYDPLLEDTKPEGIRAPRKTSTVQDEGMTEIVIDDDGHYKIVTKD